MPRIPLRDIPNAPGVMAQPTGGNLPRVSLGAAQSLLSQPTISPDAFQGAAKGMQALASGIASASDSLSNAALRLQKERDDNLLFRARAGFEMAMSEAQAEIAQNPFDYTRYGEITAGHLDRAMKGALAESKGLSPQAQERLALEFQSTRRIAFAEAQKMGFNRMRDENREATKLGVSRFLESGDSESAIALLEEQRGGDRFTDTEIDAMQMKARQDGEVLKVVQMMKMDPDEAERMLDDRSSTNHIPEMTRLRLIDQTDTERRRIDADNWEALVQGVADGSIASPEDVAGVFGERFEVKYRSKIKSVLAANPDMDKVREDYLRIDEAIKDLDPSDPEAAKRQFDMRVDIYSSLPEGFRKDALDALSAKMGRRTDSVLRSQLSESLTVARAAGVFGQWDEADVKDGDTKEYEKKKAAYAAMYRIKQEGEAWLRENPKASSEELNQWFNQRMSREVKQTQPNWWRRTMPAWLGGAPDGAPAPAPRPLGSQIDETLKRYDEGAGNAGARVVPLSGSHKITSYGYQSDRWKDSNSMKGIGAWNNRLEDKLSFAASPDVEQMLKENGIKKGGKVRLTLDNGETLDVRWDDRTAGDKTARKLGLNPLRGRWDIYTKDGRHPFDGVAVRSFEILG